ncbi:retention module-containing protein [Comamonas sp. Y33R10-2]|uniref:retention module-containing protein n=1 Tax=Comamonas sp. Y33R10-2 TaxID=2853257 RepID=UPI001C5CB433|nr:retention module-containing protein [Comamonas sp. Y33R10-2]QXZ10625.1 retention module-containing protein [Comamonas sp. Y33R10-2]
MAAQTILVTKLTGQAWIRGSDGNLTVIHEGMRIPADAQIVTASGSTVQLQADGQPLLIVGENQNVQLTADLVQPPLPTEAAIANPANAEIDQIIAAINNGQDPFENIDPTAAGLSGGSEGGSTFVRLASIIEAVSPIALAYPRPAGAQTQERISSGVMVDEQQAPPPAPPLAPAANPLAQADQGRIFEDDAAPLRGNVLGNDQLGQGTLAQHSTVLVGSAQGQYGVVSLNTDGSYSYVLDNSLQSVQSLAVGETLSETYTYTVTDAAGSTSSSTLTITVVGMNDNPAMAGEVTGSVTEDAQLTASGQLTETDVDTSDTHTWSVNNGGQGSFGNLVIDGNGKWTYTLDNDNPAVQALPEGEQREERFDATVDDGHGGTDTKTIVVIVTGTADWAEVKADQEAGRVFEEGLVAKDGSNTTSGSVTVSATDGVASIQLGNVTYTVEQLKDVSKLATVDTGEGTLKITAYAPGADGKSGTLTYEYTLKAAQTHANGQGNNTLSDSIAVTVTGNGGSTAAGNIVITIVDDMPVAQDITAGTLTEDNTSSRLSGDVTSHTGNSFGADGKAATDAVTWDTAVAKLGAATVSLSDYGTLTSNKNGTWEFVLDSSKPATQALKTGDSISVSLSYTLTDKDGDTATKAITFTILGADDTSSVTPVPGVGEDAGKVYEAGLSSVNDKTEITTGSVQVSATDGVASIQLGNVTYTVEQLKDVSKLATVDTGEGTLKITAYAPGADGKSGTLTYEYTLKAAQTHANGQGNNTLSDSIAVTVTGNGGSTAAGNIVITIVDDMPVAQDITAGTLTEDNTSSRLGGDVTSHTGNSFGADGKAATDAVTWGAAVAKLGAATVSLSDYGTLTSNKNGTWEFVLDSSKPATQALKTGDSISVSLSYTLTDKDGDTATKAITFTILGADDTSSVTPVPGVGEDAGKVYEAGLSSVNDKTEITTGSVQVSATDGVASIQLGNVTYTVEQLKDVSKLATVDTGEGTLKITAYAPGADGKSGTLTYEYTLKAAQTHANGQGNNTLSDSIAVTVTGNGGSTAAGNIVITIVDDMPVAQDITAGTLTEDNTSSRLSGDVTSHTGNSFGADGKAATDAVTWDTAVAKLGAATVSLSDYGTLTSNKNGTWEFVLDSSKPATQALKTGDSISVSLSYTLTDKDGDTATKAITFTILGADDTSSVTPVPGVGEDAGKVYEAGLSSVNDKTEITTGSVQVSATDGVASIQLGNVTYTVEQLKDVSKLATVDTGEGTLKITAYAPGADGKSGTLTYEYTLKAAQTHANGQGNNTLSDSIAVTVTGNGGSTAAGNIVITIVDDMPVAQDITAGTLTEDNTSSRLGGDVTSHTGNSFGADGKAATDAVTWGAAVAKLGAATVSLSDYGTLTSNKNGTWEFVLDSSKPATQALKTGDSISVSLSYTLTDKDGDTATKAITFTILGADDTSSVTPVPGVGEDAGKVYEAGLSSVNDKTEITTGSVQVSATDGVASIQLGNLTYTVEQLKDVSKLATVDTGEGTLKITAYAPGADGKSGTLTYEYTLKAAQTHANGQGNNTLSDSIAVTVTGNGGSTAAGNIVITIVDDMPVAQDITAGTLTEDNTSSRLSGDVTSHTGNSFGADGKAATDAVTWDTAVAKLGAATVSLSDYGTLTSNKNGTWEFVLDSTKPATQALKTGDSISVSLSYTLTDKDGDTATKAITFTILGADDTSSVTPVPGVGEDAGKVYEAGLSSVNDKTEITTGSVQVSATDGVASIQLGNVTYTVEQLKDVSKLATVDTGEGTLKITAYAPGADGKSGTLTYEYTLKAAQTHANGQGNNTLSDSIAVTVTGNGGSTAAGNIVITIVDDMPVAQDITAGTLTEDNTSSRLSGDVTSHTGNSFGADGKAATDAVTWDTAVAKLGAATVSLSDYGTLTSNKNGTWEFVLDSTKPATQALKTGDSISVSLSYTLTDKDGDTATKAITFTILGADDTSSVTPVPGVGEDAGKVYEAGLSSVNDKTEITTGSVQVSATDGVASIQLGNVTYTVEQLKDVSKLATVDTGEGTLKITAYAPGADGKSGTLTYEYTLKAAQTHANGQGNNTLSDSIAVTVTGNGGSTAAGNIVITIVDDMPVAQDITAGTLTEDNTSSRLGGDVTSHTGNSFGADGKAATDAVTWGAAVAKLGAATVSLSDYGTLTSNKNGTWEFVLDSSKPATQALKTGDSISVSLGYTLTDKDGDTDAKTITFTINGVNDATADSETTNEDTSVLGNVLTNDEGYVVGAMTVTGFTINGGSTLYKPDGSPVGVMIGSKVVGSINLEADGSYTFNPTKDWSGTVPSISYTNSTGASSTLNIVVTPVADTPVVKVNVGNGSMPITTSITNANVNSSDVNHTVKAFNANGTASTVSIKKDSKQDGFGVTGDASGDEKEIGRASNSGKSESLVIEFNTPVTAITVQFAWLASNEWARYQMFDQAKKPVALGYNADGTKVAGGLYGFVKGGTDLVETAFKLEVPAGNTISQIVFDAPRKDDDYLIHKVTYKTATTYPVTITATPQDLDYSETITKVTVEVPKGVTLSAGTQIDATHWSLPLASNGSYSVSIHPVTKAVTITGLNMTVPENVQVHEVKVVAVAADGSSTAEGSASFTIAKLATFNSDEKNAWALDNSDSTRVYKSNSDLSNTNTLSSDKDKWLLSRINGSRSDGIANDGGLVLTDNNGRANGDAKAVTPTYTSVVKGTTLQFMVTGFSNAGHRDDSVTWTLYESTNDGVTWSPVSGGVITGTGIFTTTALEKNATYRIFLTVHEGNSNDTNASVTFDDFIAIVPSSDTIALSSTAVTGLLTSNDILDSLDETSALAASRMTLLSTDTGSHEVHSTPSGDLLLGTAEDDLFVWHQGDEGTVERPVTDVVKNFGASGNDALALADLLQGEEASSDLSKFLHLETRTEADGKTIDTVIKVSTTGVLDAYGNGINQKILVEGSDLVGMSHDQNAMIKQLIDQGKLKIDHS